MLTDVHIAQDRNTLFTYKHGFTSGIALLGVQQHVLALAEAGSAASPPLQDIVKGIRRGGQTRICFGDARSQRAAKQPCSTGRYRNDTVQEEVGCMLAGKDSNDRCCDMAALKRDSVIKLNTEMTAGSQVSGLEPACGVT